MKEWSKAEIKELELKCTEFNVELSDYIDDQYACEDPNCPGAGKAHNHYSFS